MDNGNAVFAVDTVTEWEGGGSFTATATPFSLYIPYSEWIS